MNQLLIVKSAKALDAGLTSHKVNDLSTLEEGAITLFELDSDTALSAPATKNFGIALGRGANKPAFVIPEVDIDTLEIVKAMPKKGTYGKFEITAPNANAAAGDYTIMLVKKGVVPNERNTWTVTTRVPEGVTKTANAVLEELYKQIKAFADNGLNFTVVYTSGSRLVTITSTTFDEQWTIALGDGFGVKTKDISNSNTTHTVWTYSDGTTVDETFAVNPVGDKDFVQKLAHKCAAGKGFNYLAQESRDIYPGYPEAVESFTLDSNTYSGNSSVGYAIYSLHFATGRKAGKQVDERVWQYVYIAVPVSRSGSSPNYSVTDILAGILPTGKYLDSINYVAAANIAQSVVTDMVKDSALNGE